MEMFVDTKKAGEDGDFFANRPVLFFFDLTVCAKLTSVITGCPTPQVCLEACPSKNIISTADSTSVTDLICKYNVDVTKTDKDELVRDGDCAPYYFKSVELLGRCIPQIFDDDIDAEGDKPDANSTLVIGGETVTDQEGNDVTLSQMEDGTIWISEALNLQSLGQKIFQDFVDSWWLILIGLAFTMLFSLLWIILMRCLAWLIVWVSLVGMVALLGVGCYYCFKTYVDLEDVEGADASYTEIGFTTNLDAYLGLQDTWLAFGITLSVILVILLLIILVLANRISLAIELISEASKAVGQILSSLFFPIFTFILQIIAFLYWIATAVFLASSGTQQYILVNASEDLEGTNCDPDEYTDDDATQCIFVGYGGDFYSQNIFWFQIYNGFMWFWLIFFIIALGQMTLAGAFASWYWAWKKPKDVPAMPVSAALGRALRYHLGSLAFGSLLIAIVRMFRVLLEYMDYKLRGAENTIARFCLKCLRCFFWCLEKFLKFLNKNAYIMIAIYGKSFCTSAKHAFNLLMRNIIRVIVLDSVTDFLLFIGKVMIVAGLGVTSFLLFSGALDNYVDEIGYTVPTLNYFFMPVIVITVGSFVITTGFFNVYGMAVDTLFLCFLEDCERNDGSKEKPYYMSRNLMRICGKKNKKK